MIKRRFKPFASLRFDVPHLRSMESSVAADFDDVLRGMITGLNNPYVIRGFEFNIPSSAINANANTVRVSDSAVLHSTAGESGTILTVPAGTADEVLSPSNPRVVGAFQNGATNYVSLSYVRQTDPDTVDQAAGWSESQKTEFQRTVPLGQVLDYRFVISTSGFSTNLPLYIVGVDSNGATTYITKAADSLWRLGRGGTVPNPYYTFDFNGQNNTDQSPDQPRREWVNENTSVASNPVTAMPGDNKNAFLYGDFALGSFKDWADAVMTRFKEITGSSYWYLDSTLSAGSPTNFNTWYDSVGSVLTGNGYLSYNLILESDTLSYGAYQSSLTDSEIVIGDSYVIGASSNNRANVSAFNANQLIVNSMIRNDFIAGETLYNRRVYRPSLVNFSLDDTKDLTNTIAVLKRNQLLSNTTYSISSWSYTNIGAYDACDITINFSSAHPFIAGDYIAVNDLQCTDRAPNGVYMVKHVASSTQLIYSVSYTPDGSPTVFSSTASLDSGVRHPYMPRFEITDWSASGANISVTAPNHPFQTGDEVVFTGLTAAADAPNGRYTVTVSLTNTLDFTAATAPTTPAAPSGAYAQPNVVTFDLAVSGAQPDDYNIPTVTALAASDTDLQYIIGPNSLPSLITASGAISLDGVIAETTVSDPALIQDISYATSPTRLIVNTFTAHGLTSNGPLDYTIYGNVTDTAYVQTYSAVTLNVTSSTQFELIGTVPNNGSYTNGGSDAVYARFPNNPYAGPLQWSSDLIVKGVIGDRSIRIPQSATADGTSVANRFNINNLTGTAFLQDGEVAYVIMERDRLVSLGATYNTDGGSNPIYSSTPPVYTNGDPVQIGDYVKFEGEGEANWCKISNIGFSGLVDGDPLPNIATTFYVVSDNGQLPSSEQRPARSGRLLYSKATYPVVSVAKHWEVPETADIYWLAVRRDNGSLKSKMYTRALELEVGERREINDNEPSNLLIYTGAGTESATSPNYTVIDTTGQWQESEELEVSADGIDTSSRQVTFESAPDLGFQTGDQIIKTVGLTNYIYTVDHLLTSRTVVMSNDISTLSAGDSVTYRRVNYSIKDTDNLTLAIRKEDRELSKVNTALTRPIYDESVYLQQIDFTAGIGSTDIASGSYIYKGSQNQPTALAWVLHGSDDVAETIEGYAINMPGGKLGSTSILVHIISGTFLDGDTIFQNGLSTNNTIDNPLNPAFDAPALSSGLNIELVLPPNRRTQVVGSEYVVWPANASYKASQDDSLAGEELLVIANDSIRQANVDYYETYGGPKGKIELIRSMPPNTRLRFRIMPAFGSATIKLAGSATLQNAYDGGNTVNILPGRPIDVTVADRSTGLYLTGTLEIDGILSGNVVGGIMPATDKSFDIGNESKRVNEIWTAVQRIKTHSTHTGSAKTTYTAAGTSTSASAYIVPSSNLTLNESEAVNVIVTGIARRSEGVADPTTEGAASFRLEGCFYREAGGSTQVAGSPYSVVSGYYGTGFDYALTFGTSGNDIVAVAFGDSAAVEWAITVEYQRISLSL